MMRMMTTTIMMMKLGFQRHFRVVSLVVFSADISQEVRNVFTAASEGAME